MTTKPIDFLIITPLPEELDALLKKLPDLKKEPPLDDDIQIYYSSTLPIKFSDGKCANYSICVLPLADKGETEAACATSIALKTFSPRNIILVGIAGGIMKEQARLGDILIADQIACYDQVKNTMVDDQIASYDQVKNTAGRDEIRWKTYPIDQRLYIAAMNFNSENWKNVNAKRYDQNKSKVLFGPICTGNKVIANESLANQFHEIWTKLIGLEMESAGVANATTKSAIRLGFFMVRGVSDLADGNKNSNYVKRWRPYACEIAASYLIEFLKSGPIPENDYDKKDSNMGYGKRNRGINSDEYLLNKLSNLPAALFEVLVFKFDKSNSLQGREAAQLLRSIEMLRLIHNQEGGIEKLSAAINRLTGDQL